MALRIRRRRPAPITPTPTRESLRASAQRFVLTGRQLGKKQGAPKRAWQEEAWEYFDDVPELKYSVWYMGNVMAKLRIFPAVRKTDDPEAPLIPITDPESGIAPDVIAKATAELERLKGELGGQGEIIRALNMNLEVAGEGYIIGFGPRDVEVRNEQNELVRIETTDESWGVYSISQVTEKGGTYTVSLLQDDGAKGVEIKNELDTIIRVWQRHPRWSLEADCAMRGVVSDCEALTLLTNSIKAEAKSRMSGGYLALPSTLRKGPPRPEPDEGEEAVVDEFTQMLYDGATEAVEDPSAASSVAPTFIFGDREDIAAIRHISIARDSDRTVLDKIKAAIERIARGTNLPVEVVMGHQQTTFANALQVKQDTFDDHFEPRCELICDVLAIAFMQPNLIEMGVAPDVAERIVVGYDPSKMIKQVNPVDSADKGVELGTISAEAWRRAWGWTEDDAPEQEAEQPVAEVEAQETLYNVAAVLIRAGWKPEAILEALGLPPMEHTGAPPITIQNPEDTPPEPPPSAPDDDEPESADEDDDTADPIAASRAGSRTARELILAAARSDGMLLPIPPAERRNVGFDAMLLDRELRARLIVAANAALNRALELAGNRLRSKAGKIRALAKAGKVNPVYVAATLGPSLVAAAGIADDDLISDAAWTSLAVSFDQWVEAAQARALVLAGRVVPISDEQRATVEAKQAVDRAAAWEWLRDELHKLAYERLYAPDPAVPDVGEFDPTSRVPAGLIRQALDRAGGASGLTHPAKVKPALRAADRSGDVWVATNNGKPAGGIGMGETITTVLDGGGARVEGYEWVYGPAYRLHPFVPHEALDGRQFVNFTDDVLHAGDWIGPFYFPGDHDGCNCDIVPTIIGSAALAPAPAAVEPEADAERDWTPEDRLRALTRTPSDPMFPDITPRETRVDLTGLTKTMKDLIVDRVAAFAAEYPTAAQSLTSITVDTMRTKAHQGTFAFVRSWPGRPGSELHLNRRFFKNAKQFNEVLQRNAAKRYDASGELALRSVDQVVGWLARGDIKGTIDHELGHVLDNFYRQVNGQGLSSAMVEDSMFAGTLLRPAHLPNGRAWLSAQARTEMMKVSVYGQTNKQEMFAELFALAREGGVDAIAHRSPELARLWRDLFENNALRAAASSRRDDDGDPVETDVDPPMLDPRLVEEMKRDGTWPYDDDEDGE